MGVLKVYLVGLRTVVPLATEIGSLIGNVMSVVNLEDSFGVAALNLGWVLSERSLGVRD